MGQQETWKPLFLQALRKCGSVSSSARAAGVGRTTVYDARKVDEAFAAEWDTIFQGWYDDLEGAALQRALRGWSEPVYYLGQVCGTKRRHDNNLLMWCLERLRPERFAKPPEQTRPMDAALVAAEIRRFVDAAMAQDTAEGETGGAAAS